MPSLLLFKLVPEDVEIGDLGITVTGPVGATYDLITKRAEFVSASEDTVDAINADKIIILNPLDTNIQLSKDESIMAIQNHNTSHYGIVGGALGFVDDPNTPLVPGQVIQVGDTGEVEMVTPDDLINSNSVTEAIQDLLSTSLVDGTNTSVRYNDTNGTIAIDANAGGTSTVYSKNFEAVDFDQGTLLTIPVTEHQLPLILNRPYDITVFDDTGCEVIITKQVNSVGDVYITTDGQSFDGTILIESN